MALNTLRNLLSRRDPGLVWENIGRTGVVSSLFLVPLVLLPWTPDAWEINKALVLLIGIFIGWLGFFMSAMMRKKSEFDLNVLDWSVLAFVVVTLISTAFSVDSWMSWTGSSSALSSTTTMVLLGASLYFLTSRLANTDATRRSWIGALGSGLLVSVFLQVFQLSGFSLLPSVFSNNPFLTTISNNSIDIALVAAVIATAAVLVASRAASQMVRLLAIAIGLMGYVVLIYFSQPLAWAVFALGMITIVLVESRQGKKMNVRWIILAVAIAALGMIIQLSGVATQSGKYQPTDIRLDPRTSRSIMWETLQHRPILGSGPATWFHDFVAYRPVAFNASPYWANRFVRSRTAWSDLAATYGALGLLTWLGMMAIGLRQAWRGWQSDPRTEHILLAFGLLATFLIGLFVPWGLVWTVGVWMILGLVRSNMGSGQSRGVGLGVPLGFALTVLVTAVLGYYATQIYASEVLIQRGQAAILQERPIPEVKAILEPAFRMHARSITAGSLLGIVQAAEAQQALQNQRTDDAVAAVRAAVATMERVIELNPRNPVAYEEMNNVLNRLTGIAIDADERARDYFTKLRQVEPTNPIHDVGYGQTAMLSRARLLSEPTVTDAAKKQADALLKAALDAYAAALKKKPDYLQARFARAQTLVSIERYESALQDLEAIRDSASDLPTFWIQYGTTLSKLNRDAEAVQAFTQAIELAPNEATTYVSLADHYVANDEKANAKAVLEQGLTVLPDDPTLKSKLETVSG